MVGQNALFFQNYKFCSNGKMKSFFQILVSFVDNLDFFNRKSAFRIRSDNYLHNDLGRGGGGGGGGALAPPLSPLAFYYIVINAPFFCQIGQGMLVSN